MALIDKYADVNLAMVMVILQVMSLDKLGLVLRFAESLAEKETERANE